MKRQIIVSIDAGEAKCAFCHMEDEYGYCHVSTPLRELNKSHERLPACLEAEAQLTRLVEAAREMDLTICSLCKRINPHHDDCDMCQEREERQSTLAPFDNEAKKEPKS